MPLEDLDLEFEDEDEQKKKRNEAVQVDVDSLFAAQETPAKAAPGAAPAGAAAPARPQAAPAATAQVRKLDEARAQLKRPAAPAGTPAPAAAAPRPVVQGATALQAQPQEAVDDAALLGLMESLEETRLEGRVQAAVADYKLGLLADVLSDVKLLDHQVHQLLVRINQKHPELKPEVMAIKKLLADFSAKKRK